MRLHIGRACNRQHAQSTKVDFLRPNASSSQTPPLVRYYMTVLSPIALAGAWARHHQSKRASSPFSFFSFGAFFCCGSFFFCAAALVSPLACAGASFLASAGLSSFFSALSRAPYPPLPPPYPPCHLPSSSPARHSQQNSPPLSTCIQSLSTSFPAFFSLSSFFSFSSRYPPPFFSISNGASPLTSALPPTMLRSLVHNLQFMSLLRERLLALRDLHGRIFCVATLRHFIAPGAS